MQQLTAPPRDSLSADQVWSLLRDSPDAVYDRGCEVLNADLTIASDVSAYLEGGTVSHDFTVTDGPHRTCNLKFRSGFAFDTGTQLLRPYLTISDGLVTGRFDLGVFRAGRPQTDWSTTPGTVTIPGSDLLVFLAGPIGRAYAVPSGTTYRAAALQLWSDAGMPTALLLDSTNASLALDADKTWPVAQENTWLAALNWLLAGMKYGGVHVDEQGVGHGSLYVEPTQRPVDATLSFDDLLTAVVAADRQDATDQGTSTVTNVWIFQNQNVDSPTEGAGQYTAKNQSSGPTSIDAQGGREWPTVISLDVPDQASLVAAGDAQVDAALTAARVFTLHTRPFPVAGHGDVYRYNDLAATGSPSVVVQEQSWTVDLGSSTTAPADQEFKVGTVVGWVNTADES